MVDDSNFEDSKEARLMEIESIMNGEGGLWEDIYEELEWCVPEDMRGAPMKEVLCALTREVFGRHVSASIPQAYTMRDRGVDRFNSLLEDARAGNARQMRQFRDCYRMDIRSFDTLLELCEPDLTQGGDIMSEAMKLALALDFMAQGSTVRVAAAMYELSTERVQVGRLEALYAIVRLGGRNGYLSAPRTEATLHASATSWCAQSPKFSPFYGVVGAVDGSHIHMKVPASVSKNYRVGRKGGVTTMNAMAISDAAGRVSVVAPGASGTCHDSHVLAESCALETLEPHQGFYLLGDAGYALSRLVMTPYSRRGLRYHLKEFAASSGQRPKNRYELFNLRHAQLRNAVERLFGRLRARFRVLRYLPCDLDVNNSIVLACAVLHNFLADMKDNVTPDERNEWAQKQGGGSHTPPQNEDHDEEVEPGSDHATNDDHLFTHVIPEHRFVHPRLSPAERRDMIALQLWWQYAAVLKDTKGIMIVEQK